MKVTVELKLWAVSLFFENNDGGEDAPAVQHTLDIMGAVDEESVLGAAIIKAGEDGVWWIEKWFCFDGLPNHRDQPGNHAKTQFRHFIS